MMIDSDVKRELLIGGTLWEHYKGDVYVGQGVSLHTETEEETFVYTNSEGRIFNRPIDMFLENVIVDGQEKERFRFVGVIFNGAGARAA